LMIVFFCRPKTVMLTDPMKDSNVETSVKKSPASPPTVARMNPNDPGKYSFRLQQQPHLHEPKSQPKSAVVNTDTRTSLRPHTNIQEHTYGASPFQRNAPVRQTMPANSQYNRGLSSSVTTATSVATNKYADDPDEMLSSHPSLTKVYMNKSFALRRQRSNLVPSTVKPAAPQPQQPQPSVPKSLLSRQMLKGTTSIPSTSLLASSMSNASGQTNRAVELRRARAQAKIEELAQRTRQQLQKTEHHGDVMSTSWHSNASSGSKKDSLQLRSNIRSTYAQIPSQKQDLSKTRTISSSSHHRSSSASPNPLGETAASSRYRKAMVSSVTDEPTYQKMNGSTYSEGVRTALERQTNTIACSRDGVIHCGMTDKD
jgi:type II secretory pathway pseudopilin PulG